MNCPACGCNSHRYVIGHPLTGEPKEVRRCLDCQREVGDTAAGPKWILLPFYCADAECRAPIYRTIPHPRTGMTLHLWPDPNHVIAQYRVLKGPDGKDPRRRNAKRRHVGPYPITYQPYCSTDCAPDLGAAPHHTLEEGGAPHRYTVGPCVGYQRARDRHAEFFTPERGEFYRLWLAEELRLPEEQRAALMAQWTADAAS